VHLALTAIWQRLGSKLAEAKRAGRDSATSWQEPGIFGLWCGEGAVSAIAVAEPIHVVHAKSSSSDLTCFLSSA
jgi:hypothetical protein